MSRIDDIGRQESPYRYLIILSLVGFVTSLGAHIVTTNLLSILLLPSLALSKTFRTGAAIRGPGDPRPWPPCHFNLKVDRRYERRFPI